VSSLVKGGESVLIPCSIGGTMSQQKEVFGRYCPLFRSFPYLPACMTAGLFPVVAALTTFLSFQEVGLEAVAFVH
jgi:hypothetical protein